jgi:hypothetical protein
MVSPPRDRTSVELASGSYCPALDASQDGLLPIVRTAAEYDAVFAHPNCMPVEGTLPPRPGARQALLLMQDLRGCNGCRVPLSVDIVSGRWVLRVLEGPVGDCDAEIPVGAWALVADENLPVQLARTQGACP